MKILNKNHIFWFFFFLCTGIFHGLELEAQINCSSTLKTPSPLATEEERARDFEIFLNKHEESSRVSTYKTMMKAFAPETASPAVKGMLLQIVRRDPSMTARMVIVGRLVKVHFDAPITAEIWKPFLAIASPGEVDMIVSMAVQRSEKNLKLALAMLADTGAQWQNGFKFPRIEEALQDATKAGRAILNEKWISARRSLPPILRPRDSVSAARIITGIRKNEADAWVNAVNHASDWGVIQAVIENGAPKQASQFAIHAANAADTRTLVLIAALVRERIERDPEYAAHAANALIALLKETQTRLDSWTNEESIAMRLAIVETAIEHMGQQAIAVLQAARLDTSPKVASRAAEPFEIAKIMANIRQNSAEIARMIATRDTRMVLFLITQLSKVLSTRDLGLVSNKVLERISKDPAFARHAAKTLVVLTSALQKKSDATDEGSKTTRMSIIQTAVKQPDTLALPVLEIAQSDPLPEIAQYAVNARTKLYGNSRMPRWGSEP